VFARRDWLKAHPELAQAYVDSIVQGIARTKRDPNFAANSLKKYMKLDDDKAALAAAQWSAANVLADSPSTQAASFADILTILSQKGAKTEGFDASKFIDNSFVESAASRGVAAGN
jgi:ABC-type nitrate/sulfonate/bicarbonate transport system substrate-binding protein